MAGEIKHLMDEADIGSGEKPTGQEDVEKDTQSLQDAPATKPLNGSQYGHEVVEEQAYAEQRPSPEEQRPTHKPNSTLPGRIMQRGDHIARILAVRQPDDTFEAQVYVRLAREPEIAETYIPAGIYATEDEAWGAASERADRAFREHEF
jgi:hypothetical protein